MNSAISDLYWFRVYNDLEYAVMFRRQLDMPWFDPRYYSMCSAETQQLANILTSYITYNCCDDRPINYYPLLDRIIEWMDTTYGGN